MLTGLDLRNLKLVIPCVKSLHKMTFYSSRTIRCNFMATFNDFARKHVATCAEINFLCKDSMEH